MFKVATLEGARFDGREIVLSPELDRIIQDQIESQDAIVLKSVFPKEVLRGIKRGLVKYAREHAPQTLPVEIGTTPNHHRIDQNPEKSQLKRISQCFFSYYWNERELVGERACLLALAGLRNRLAGLRKDYAFYQLEDGYISSPTTVHYPRGGGYLSPHADPPSKQKVVVIAILSQRGRDYTEGGLYIESLDGTNREMIDTAMDEGDVYLLKPAVRHGVAPIDPSAPLGLDAEDGRWMMFSTLVHHVSLQGKKVEGLQAY